ncbi:hypothetical protein BKA61DRAFT_607077 [Leptodontidium sp. MPI-SDFR-AT-0119]|nr:hypothetical protein BKA61DRAFT_607077 [Leptodontidium sp. MPI-SDFR-AT-0119]
MRICNWVQPTGECFDFQFQDLTPSGSAFSNPPGFFQHQETGGAFEPAPAYWDHQYANSGNDLPVQQSIPFPAANSNLMGVGINPFESTEPRPDVPIHSYAPQPQPTGDEKEPKVVRCLHPDCPKTFTAERDRERHDKQVHNKPARDEPLPLGWYECICGHRDSRKDTFCGLRRHFTKCTKPAVRENYLCRCRQPFVDREEFAAHIKTCGKKTPGRKRAK